MAWKILSQTFSQWQNDGALTWAAALAFTTVTSMAPLVTVCLLVASNFYGEAALRGELVARVQELVGKPGAELIQMILANATQKGSGIAAFWSIAVLLLGASAVFAQLQTALNTLWNVAPKPDLPWSHTIKARVLSMTLVVGAGLLLLALAIGGTAVTVAAQSILRLAPAMQFLVQLANFGLGVLVFTGFFGAIFKVLPDAVVGWRLVWMGAFVTALLFNIGRFAITFYLAKAAPGNAYGAAGSIIVVLLWTYYSACILFLGAEFTQVYARQFGVEIRPAPYAYRVSALAVPLDEAGNPILHENLREQVQKRNKCG